MTHRFKHSTRFVKILFFCSVITLLMCIPVTAADPFAAAYGGFGHEKTAAADITSDGGVIAVGQTDSFGAGDTDMWLVKLDAAGKIEWQKAVGGPGFDTAHSVHQIVGGYIVAGVTTSDDGNKDIAVIKLDSGGAVQWQKTYGGTAPEDKPVIHPIGDGFILCALTASFGAGETDIQVLRLDNNGDVIWQRTYGGAGFEKNPFIQPVSEGGYIMACSSDSFVTDPDNDSDTLVLKLNDNGTIAWQKSYGGDKFESEPVIRQNNDGKYIIGASTQSFGIGFINILLFQLDNTGLVEWSKVFGQSEIVYTPSDIRPTDDSYIIAANRIAHRVEPDFDKPEFKIKTAFFKVDNTGAISWQKLYGNDDIGTVTANTVHLTGDNKYFITGGRFNNDFFVIQTDEAGDLPGCGLDNLSDIQIEDVTLAGTDISVVSANSTVNPSAASLASIDSNGFGHFFCNPPVGGPVIDAAGDEQTLADGSISAEIWAHVTDGGNGIDKVRALITPPDQSGNPSEHSEAESIDLTYNSGTDRYVGIYDNFQIFGYYKITFYAQDSAGNFALPKVIQVYQDAVPDMFENDNSITQAHTMIPDIFDPRRYNFYNAEDEDWIQFYGSAGATYTVYVSNLMSGCDAMIDIFNAAGEVIASEDSEITGGDEELTFDVIQEGKYFVKISPYGSSIAGIKTGYNLIISDILGPLVAIFEGDIRSGSPAGPFITNALINFATCGDLCLLVGEHFSVNTELSAGHYHFKVTADGHLDKTYQFVLFSDGSVWIDSDYETYNALYLDPLPKNSSEPTTTSTTTSTVPTSTTTIPTAPTITSTIPTAPTTTSPTNQNSSPSSIVPVYRLYSEGLTVHLFTTDENEKNTLEPTDIWRYEGTAWYVYPDYQNGVVPVYRLYSEGLKIHLFTIDENEKATLEQTDVWRYEGIAWYVFPDWQDGLVPVYRLYSEGLKKHLYTRDENEKNTLENTDVWRYEGIAYYAYPTNR
ncbi:hypothetical protein QUF90_03410 [Desulfococcaceae bacterium HSG9]|nr:hypothetical protein [Desulfococcaceae bacterium HSG9]